MSKTQKTFLKSLAVAVALSAPLAGAALIAPTAAMAQVSLPAPYVSRALQAVLIPVDASVISTFGLDPASTGVFVLATDPTGLAASAGIEAGDVIDYVRGEAVLTPAELDEVVYYWIKQGQTDFKLNGKRGGAPLVLDTVVTLEIWETVIDVTTVESWTSYSSESFSYSEFTSEYSEEMTASYESSESSVEEATSSEEFQSDMQAEDEGYTEEEATSDDSSDDAATDEATDDTATDDGGDAGGDEGGDDVVE